LNWSAGRKENMKLKKYDIAYEDVQSHELELNMILPQVVSENRA